MDMTENIGMHALFYAIDFIEILISNGPFMIIKNAKIGEFRILWVHNIEKALRSHTTCYNLNIVHEKVRADIV